MQDNLQIIEKNNQRVLTTAQLAEVFGTDAKQINRNFQRNSQRFEERKHFYALSGEELKEFKGTRQNDPTLKYTSVLYLWTEKGAWLIAKTINTDSVWDAYETLVDDYYTIKEQKVIPLSKDQALVTVLRTTANLMEDTESIKAEQHEMRKLITKIDEKVETQITLDYGEQRRLQKAVATRVYELEEDPSIRPKLFREIYREIKDRFAVASYKDVKRQDLQSAINYIENFIPKRVS